MLARICAARWPLPSSVHASKHSCSPLERLVTFRHASGNDHLAWQETGKACPSGFFAPHRGLSCMGNLVCMGLFILFLVYPLGCFARHARLSPDHPHLQTVATFWR